MHHHYLPIFQSSSSLSSSFPSSLWFISLVVCLLSKPFLPLSHHLIIRSVRSLIYTHSMLPACLLLLMYTRNLFYCLLLRHSTPHLFKSIPSFVGRSFSTTSSCSVVVLHVSFHFNRTSPSLPQNHRRFFFCFVPPWSEWWSKVSFEQTPIWSLQLRWSLPRVRFKTPHQRTSKTHLIFFHLSHSSRHPRASLYLVILLPCPAWIFQRRTKR